MLWNYHHECGSRLLLSFNVQFNMPNMQQIWTFKFLEVVRQHILGVVYNVITPFCWKLTRYPAVKEFWKSVKIWRNYRHKRMARLFETQCTCSYTRWCVMRTSSMCLCCCFARARRIQRWAEVLGHSLYEACAKATAITDIRAVSTFAIFSPDFRPSSRMRINALRCIRCVLYADPLVFLLCTHC